MAGRGLMMKMCLLVVVVLLLLCCFCVNIIVVVVVAVCRDRGWTTWTTVVVDMIPIVMDALNLQKVRVIFMPTCDDT